MDEHLLSQVPYGELPHAEVTLSQRVYNPEYHRGPVPKEMYAPAAYCEGDSRSCKMGPA